MSWHCQQPTGLHLPREVIPVPGEALIPRQFVLPPLPCPRSWQPDSVCLLECGSGSSLTWMLADPRIPFYAVFFAFPPHLKSETKQCAQELQFAKGDHCQECSVMEGRSGRDYWSQLLGSLISVHQLLWLRHSRKLKRPNQLTNRTYIFLLSNLLLMHPRPSPTSGHIGVIFTYTGKIVLEKPRTCLM